LEILLASWGERKIILDLSFTTLGSAPGLLVSVLC
jgi:hypothetical protein